MRLTALTILMFCFTLAFSQKEASVWYFGKNAGLKFNDDGSVTALSNGQLNTYEGCSTIADSNGNLLFYTDGRTVWDRNHVKMPNGDYSAGTPLYGDSSSTQSGIIVPNPSNPDIYYIFTVDEPHHQNATAYPNAFSGVYDDGTSTPSGDDGFNRGFNYSIVDLTVVGSNGSIGDVTTRNNHLVTYDTNPLGDEIKYKCGEKITAVKDSSGNGIWVVTQFIDRFYSFKVDASGVNVNPVISITSPTIPLSGYRRNALGYLKASPTGDKLAVAHMQNTTVTGSINYDTGSSYVYDFNNLTGVVTNPTLVIDNVACYGVEFSKEGNLLYVSYEDDSTFPHYKLAQFDLQSSSVPNSKIVINSQNTIYGALQLAINNKIYFSYQNNKLGVINSPDVLGVGCNYDPNGPNLSPNTQSYYGLPPFITSFFNVSFTAQNLCFGDITTFTLNTSEPITSILWDFGDGVTSNLANPTHQYLAVGNYNVTVTATTATQTTTKSRIITISQAPSVANSVPNQTVCGTNGMNYDLSQFNSLLLGSQSTTDFGVAYFLSMTDATNHFNVISSFTNLSIGTTTLYAKVYSKNNSKCSSITSFTISLFNQPIGNAVNPIFACDDVSNDGIASYNLGSLNSVVLGSQSGADYTVSYHLNQADADSNSNALAFNYQNISNPQTIYVRIENNLNVNCYATTSFQIGVNKMPIANSLQDLYTCDDSSNDGIETFNLSSQTSALLGTQVPSEFNVSYHLSQSEADTNTFPLLLNYQNINNPQTIFVRIENTINPSCYDTTSFQLKVMPKPNLVMDATYTICEGVPINIEAPLGFSTYNWSTGSTTNSTIINQAGTYTLTVTQNYGTIICDDSETITVLNSNVATITQIETVDWTESENSIGVVVTGDGDYEYSLDGLSYQDSPNFYGLISGEYTVFVRDKKGCGVSNETVYLLMYPKFFTPNSDGANDKWRIKNSSVEPNMQLFIYDRYGKLLKQLSSLGEGWDGIHNGIQMPADDYWFVVKRENGKEYRGHFCLKR